MHDYSLTRVEKGIIHYLTLLEHATRSKSVWTITHSPADVFGAAGLSNAIRIRSWAVGINNAFVGPASSQSHTAV
jgi:hypothetical protein